MDMLDINLKLLNKINLNYREEIDRISTEQEKKTECELITAKDGTKSIIIIRDEKKVRLNSLYHPSQEAERWVKQYNFDNLQMNVIFFGLGNGLFAKNILSNLGQDADLFIYEPDTALLVQLLQNIDYTDLFSDSRVHLILGSWGEEAIQNILLPYMNWLTIPTQIKCTHPGYDILYSAELDWFDEKLQRMRNSIRVNRNTDAFFSHIYIKNAILNLRYIKNSNHLLEYENCLTTDTPVIIVSAGPSLDKNIEMLKKAQGKSVIFAVDTSVRHLEKNKIAYDCMVTSDPAKPENYFTDVPGCKDFPLICGIESNYKIMNFHKGRKIWCGGDVIISRIYFDHGMKDVMGARRMKQGGSVATLALTIAMYMGSRRIILVGQDLAYGQHGSHAGGEISTIRGEESQKMWVEGIDGKPIKTRWDWRFYKEWFEEIICNRPDLEVIDATEGGALIKGSKIMTLSEAIDKYCTCNIDFRAMVSDKLPTFDDNEYQEIREDILQLEREIEEIYEKVSLGIEYCEEYIKNEKEIKQNKRDDLLRKIGKVNQFVLSREANDILDRYTASLAMSELAELNKVTGDERQDDLISVQSAHLLYKNYKSAAKDILAMFEESRENI